MARNVSAASAAGTGPKTELTSWFGEYTGVPFANVGQPVVWFFQYPSVRPSAAVSPK